VLINKLNTYGGKMNIEHLRAFLEVAETGSFQLAAEKLHVTQSTISARIKTLEERLNRLLYIRKRNGAVLTSAGNHLHRHALTAVQAWERARQEIALPDDFTGIFSLGIQINHWNNLAPPWLQWMEQGAPHIATRVISDYSDPLMRMLRDGLLDMAILYAPQQRPNLYIEKFMEETIILVSTEPRGIEVGRVAGYVFVDWGDDFRAQHSLAFPEASIPRLSVGLGSVGLEHILKYGGSGYFLENSVLPFIEEGKLHRVEDAPVFLRPTYLGYPETPPDLSLQAIAIHGLKKVAQSLNQKVEVSR